MSSVQLRNTASVSRQDQNTLTQASIPTTLFRNLASGAGNAKTYVAKNIVGPTSRAVQRNLPALVPLAVAGTLGGAYFLASNDAKVASEGGVDKKHIAAFGAQALNIGLAALADYAGIKELYRTHSGTPVSSDASKSPSMARKVVGNLVALGGTASIVTQLVVGLEDGVKAGTQLAKAPNLSTGLEFASGLTFQTLGLAAAKAGIAVAHDKITSGKRTPRRELEDGYNESQPQVTPENDGESVLDLYLHEDSNACEGTLSSSSDTTSRADTTRPKIDLSFETEQKRSSQIVRGIMDDITSNLGKSNIHNIVA